MEEREEIREAGLNLLILPAIAGPIVLGILSRTRTWAVLVQAVLAVSLILLGVAMAAEPLRWIQHPPKDLPGGLPIDMQLFGTQVGGLLLVLWAMVWLLVSLARQARGAERRRPSDPSMY